MVIKNTDKKFVWEQYWAETIQRKRFQNKDYLFAYIRRKHAYDDVNMEGEGQWIGLEQVPIHQMTIDKDENSDTQGQRIKATNDTFSQDGTVTKRPIIKGMKFEYIFEANKKNIENFKKLASDTIHGTTQLIWCLRSKNYNCEYPEDFWVSKLEDVEDAIRKKGSIRSGNVPTS